MSFASRCLLAGLVAVLPVSCSTVEREASTSGEPVRVAALLHTEAIADGKVKDAVLVPGSGEAAGARIVAAVGMGGVEVYGLDGQRLGSMRLGEAVSVDVVHDVDLAGDRVTLAAVIDALGHRLRLFRLDGVELHEVGAREITLGFAAEGVCLMRSRLDGSLHAFVVGDGGEIDHHLLFATMDGSVDARQVRRFGVPSTLGKCVVDPAAGTLYVSEEDVGIWRFNADPEADLKAELVDSPRIGTLDEVDGLAILDRGSGQRWLLASDAGAGHVNAYDIERGEAFLGSFTISAPDGGKIGEPGALSVTGAALGERFPAGALLVGDADGPDFKLVQVADIVSAFGSGGSDSKDAHVQSAPATATVTALVETVPVESYGDAADDPAIWAHPTHPERSVIVATDKKAGLYVYDMRGQVKQFLPDGKMNNVDLRDGFRLGNRDITLVAASNRTEKTIALYRLDPETAQLSDVADGPQPTGMLDPYGLCMYRSARSGETYVFVNGDDTVKRQWRLVDAGNGRVRTELVRELAFGSQTEGCVADDAAGVLYVGEEDVALWKLPADPDGGDEMTAVDRVDANPAIKDDLEGMGLYDLGDGRGYIVVSSQGNDTYAVYRREGGQEYLGSFAVVADPARGIDGISETDGLDVSSANLGPGLEHGAMVAQDGRNVLPAQNQNYKIVPWQAIAKALGLEMRQP